MTLHPGGTPTTGRIPSVRCSTPQGLPKKASQPHHALMFDTTSGRTPLGEATTSSLLYSFGLLAGDDTADPRYTVYDDTLC